MSAVYACIYYLLVTPAGFLYRLCGGDAMQLSHHSEASAFIVREHVFTQADLKND